jgi:ATP-dependent helicase/nuclease subunit A
MSAFTQSQQLAIAAHGNVLVVAGAGTGKTSTLVARCIHLVLDENVALDRILMVTFTEAAAAEMRQRLREALQKRLDAAPADERVARQAALLDTAFISTLHGFCLRLVREHFHELRLDPDVQVLDEEHTRPLASDTLDELFERHYAPAAPDSQAVHELVRRIGRGSDEPVRRLVLDLHRFTQTLPDPGRWLDEQVAAFSSESPVKWRECFVASVGEWARRWRGLVDVDSACENVRVSARALAALPLPPTFSEAAEVVRQAAVADKGMAWAHGSKKHHRDAIADFFEDAELLRSLVEPSTEGDSPVDEDWAWTRPHILTLLRLAREFTTDFTRAKRDLAGVDFADLEQLSLRLLRDAEGRPTATALAWRARLDRVFVDECQDINAAQDAILRALSREGAAANRFLVGDVKQSIYRFRLAEPRIFADYAAAWKDGLPNSRRLPLADNFRSHESLLQFVNAFFAPLLRKSVGGVDYDADAALQFGGKPERAALSAGSDPKPRVELHVLPNKLVDATSAGSDEDESIEALADLPATQREARMVARRLKELHDSRLQVWGKAGAHFRDVEWADMAVLLRAPSGRVETWAQEFHAAGVPLFAERAGFWEAQEVVDLVSLQRVLDNPHQDIPLLAVLRSPLVAMSLEELAAVRAGCKRGTLWEAVKECSVLRAPCAVPAGPNDTKHETRVTQLSAHTKSKWLTDRIISWRALLRHASLTDCLETILAETHFEPLTLAGERGPERVANVRRLLDLARQFDPWQRQGLFRFLRFVAGQEDEKVKREPAAQSATDAVRLMSIHQSKGLEFPVVVVADLGKQFNMDSARRDVLFDARLGVCPKVMPDGTDGRYASTAWWLASAQARREGLGEELRLLYVAMTRARDRLVLTGTLPRLSKANAEALRTVTPAAAVGERELMQAKGMLDWVLLWLRRHATKQGGLASPEGASSLLTWQWHDDASLGQPCAPVPAAAAEPGGDATSLPPSEVGALRGRLEWRYPFEPATTESAKTSVSALKRRAEPDEDAREWPLGEVFSVQCSAFSEGAKGDRRLTAAERGTAHHVFQQRVDLGQIGSAAELQAEAERMVRDATLTAEQAAALDFDALAGFWNSEVGRKIVGHRDRVRREVEFTARLSPAELAKFPGLAPRAELAADEFVVVQGRVDLVVMFEHELWLLDFKTDRFAADATGDRVREHSSQLRLYAEVLSRIHQKPVTARWLHFFSTGTTEAV